MSSGDWLIALRCSTVLNKISLGDFCKFLKLGEFDTPPPTPWEQFFIEVYNSVVFKSELILKRPAILEI